MAIYCMCSAHVLSSKWKKKMERVLHPVALLPCCASDSGHGLCQDQACTCRCRIGAKNLDETHWILHLPGTKNVDDHISNATTSMIRADGAPQKTSGHACSYRYKCTIVDRCLQFVMFVATVIPMDSPIDILDSSL